MPRLGDRSALLLLLEDDENDPGAANEPSATDDAFICVLCRFFVIIQKNLSVSFSPSAITE